MIIKPQPADLEKLGKEEDSMVDACISMGRVWRIFLKKYLFIICPSFGFTFTYKYSVIGVLNIL